MKYSIRGYIKTNDETVIVSTINNYDLWRLITQNILDELENNIFTFETWVNTDSELNLLFNELKSFVNIDGDWIDWHECTHDQLDSSPCVIAETYSIQGG